MPSIKEEINNRSADEKLVHRLRQYCYQQRLTNDLKNQFPSA